MIGSIIDDKYKIEKRIGKGGFGVVYRGFDLKLKRAVAIKLLGDVEAEASFKERFRREYESMAKLNHPNIVTIYDCGEYLGRPYMIMELVNGPTLITLIERTPVELSNIIGISIQICQAMAYAHEQGVIHRDLKLNNIMIDENSQERIQVKLLDFGLAKLMHAHDQTSGTAMVGTPLYMSPELINGQRADERADIFSFGVGLYRMVNGCFPFEAEHPTAIMYLIVNKDDLEFGEHVPAELREIIVQCMEKDPRDRFQTFKEIIDQLRALQQGLKDSLTASVSISQIKSFALRSSKRNPYLNRVMIQHPVDFYGRKREIRRVYSRLDAPHPQSISIVGERRIGKSSLLNYIYNKKNRKANMQNYGDAIFAYLDFQRNVDFDTAKFIDFLFSVFSYETGDGERYTKREKSLDQLKDVIQELNDRGKRIILLMDEFESITKNERFPESFFAFLRSMANTYRVAYVTSSYDELQLMCHNKDISDSPFFNIFSTLPLRPFGEDEARELIAQPSKREGVPIEAHTDAILDMAGCHPFYLQIACSYVFEHLLDEPEKAPNWEEIRVAFKDEVVPHYNFVWDRMDPQERENLLRLASGKPISRKYEFINDDLLRRGYLQQDAAKDIRIFSSSFKDFVGEKARSEKGKTSFFKSWFGRA
jgi:serine/threonine protein kinase